MVCKIIFLALVLHLPLVVKASENAEHRKLIVPDDYLKNEKPPGKTYLMMAFEILDVSEISEKDYTIKVDLNILYAWNDSRLIIKDDVFYQLSVKDRWYSLGVEDFNAIWTPSFTIVGGKSSENIMSDPRKSLFSGFSLTPDPAQRIYVSVHKTIVFGCPLDFSGFPFDIHNCYFEITLDAPIQEIEIVHFNFAGRSWGRELTTTLLKFAMSFSDLPNERKNRPHEYFSGFTPNISYAGFQLHLQRKSTPYLFNYYLPCGLFVIVSWANFVIPVDAIPGRVALLITNFLVQINIATSAFSNSPTSQGVNFIQVYLISCIVFVFIASSEYFILLYRRRFLRAKVNKNKADSESRKVKNKNFPSLVEPSKDFEVKVDKLSLITMPSLFCLFNAVYWYIVWIQ